MKKKMEEKINAKMKDIVVISTNKHKHEKSFKNMTGQIKFLFYFGDELNFIVEIYKNGEPYFYETFLEREFRFAMPKERGKFIEDKEKYEAKELALKL